MKNINKMNTRTIEMLAVCNVIKAVEESSFFSTYINYNDKEISWDGTIDVFNEEKGKKKNLRGRFPVQVKGTEQDDLSKKKISFQMKVADLKNYLDDGGCFIFVVYIKNSSTGTENKIYYAGLLPTDLIQILDKAKYNKNITLKEFPQNINDRTELIINFLENYKYQKGYTKGETITFSKLEQLEKDNMVESIITPWVNCSQSDKFRTFVKNDSYIYIKIKHLEKLCPLQVIPQNKIIREEYNKYIIINNKILYKNCYFITSNEGKRLHFGDSFYLDLDEKDIAKGLVYEQTTKIRKMEKDITTMLLLADGGYFTYGKISQHLNSDDMELKKYNFNNQKKKLEFAHDVVNSLNLIGCNEDIDLKELSKEESLCLKFIAAYSRKTQLRESFLKKIDSNFTPDTNNINFKIGKMDFNAFLEKSKKSKVYSITNIKYSKEE